MQTRCSVSGRLGPMVTFTLKLGISILNGGNVVVQQVQHIGIEGETLMKIIASDCLTHHLRVRCVCLLENAGLPERQKRCWVFQKFIRTHAVLQVCKIYEPALLNLTPQSFRLVSDRTPFIVLHSSVYWI